MLIQLVEGMGGREEDAVFELRERSVYWDTQV